MVAARYNAREYPPHLEGSALIEKATPDQLRRKTSSEEVGCEHTGQLVPLSGIIGQQRAVRALRFGLGIKARGFNIYIAGAPGTGKTSAATDYLKAAAREQPTPSDWVYVNSFKDPYQPRALRLAAGMGRVFADDVRELIERIKAELPKAFESAAYTEQRGEVAEKLADRRRELLGRLTSEAKERDMAIQATPAGFVIVPVRDDKPLDDDQIEGLSEDERNAMMERRDEVEAELKTFLGEMRAAEKEAATAIRALDREVTVFAIGHLVDELDAKYAEVAGASAYLRDLEEDIIDKQALFRGQEGGGDSGGEREAKRESRDRAGRDVRFRRYEVNILVDNGERDGAPVITELNPTYSNLFGKIEKESYMGALTTDHTLIRPGALHRANGGYLVVPARELLGGLFSYETLKLAVRKQEITIEETTERLGLTTIKSLAPEPIPLDVKVVLIGDPYLHFLLHAYDPDFGELWKVKAEFGTMMDRTPENTDQYAAFVCTLCEKEGLRHLESGAVAALTEHSARLAGDQHKLSTEFSEVADLVREADYYAAEDGEEYIKHGHVESAIEERHYRSNLIEERLRELVADGVVLIDTGGERPGQVNGLSVLSLGDLMFGLPARITATVGMGRGGVVDIEREARLGGPIHTKGVLIMGGFLNQRYAREMPLSLSARLVFEQSYGRVDGDSASLAETCALLSELAGVPIRQSVAITGSMNQKGEAQAIGGVNEKIEGFFATCRLSADAGGPGLDGSQGVVIPESNVRHLMLRTEVVEAVREGKFNVWPVRSVDEALAVLTGRAAGEADEDGRYPADSVNGLAAARLAELANKMVSYGASGATVEVRSEAGATAGEEPQPPQPPPVVRE